jgi:15-cis-phytoene synthase
VTELSASRAYCAGVMRKHSKSFFFSTRLLPRAKREAIEALYGFFRCVDDAVDEGTDPADARRTALEHYRRDVEGLYARRYRSCSPWFPALAAAFGDFSLDREPLLRLIDGCASDLAPVDVKTLAELERYSAAVAGTVGRSVIPILGAGDADSLERAEQLGIAMQFTNILRDTGADRKLGRNYLPFAQFPREPASSVMRTVAAEARKRYRAAAALAPRLPNDGSRAALLMAATFYENILSGVERRGFDPDARRVYVSDARKIGLAARCVVSAYTGLAIIR